MNKSSGLIKEEAIYLINEFESAYEAVAKRMGIFPVECTTLPKIGNNKSNYITLKTATPASSDKEGYPTFHRRELKIARVRRQVSYQREEYDEDEDKSYTSDVDYLKMPSEQIMYGSPHSVIDDMPNMTRMLVEESTFYNGSNNLFRMVDPIAQASSYLKSKSANLSGYEFANGGGIDQEDIDNWQNGGVVPTLLMFTRDLMPEHQCDEAQIIILEPGMNKLINIPENEDYKLISIYGNCTVKKVSLKKPFEKILKCNDKILLEGDTIIQLSNQFDSDVIIAIGKTKLDSDNNDMLDYALSAGYGYLDIYQMQDHTIDTMSEIDVMSIEDEDTILSDNTYSSFIPNGIVPDLSLLSSGIPKDRDKQVELWTKETSRCISMSEWRIRHKYRKLLDTLSLNIDSPYFCKGFKAPPIQWQRILQEEPTEISYIAEQRKEFFECLLIQAKSIDSMKKLFGGEKGGFYGKIRIKNTQDRDLAKKWSDRPQYISVKDCSGKVVMEKVPSEFDKKRTEYIEKLKQKGFSEDAIKRKVWFWFDRIGGRKEAIYDNELICKCGTNFTKRCTISEIYTTKCQTCENIGNFINQRSVIATDKNGKALGSKTTEDSIWRQRRNEAFKELNCTKVQWNTIYCQLDIQKKRIRMREQLLPDRLEAYQEIRDLFVDCNTVKELDNFKTSIYKQIIDKTGKIVKLSLVDRISFGDEKTIKFALNKRHKELLSKNH